MNKIFISIIFVTIFTAFGLESNCYLCDMTIRIKAGIEPRKAFITNDNSYIISGNISINFEKKDGDPQYHVFLIKIGKDCEPIWQKAYVRSRLEDRLWDIAEAKNGSLIAVGQIRISNKNDSYSFGQPYGWIFKINSRGDILWQKIFKEVYEFNIIIESINNEYFVIGQGKTTDVGSIIMKLDNDGKILWQKVTTKEMLGYHKGTSTKDRGFILVGHTSNKLSPCLQNNHPIIAKFTSEGEIQWQKGYEIDDRCRWGGAIVILKSNDDGFLIGSMNHIDEDDHLYNSLLIMKINQDGEIKWQKLYSGMKAPEIHNAWKLSDGNYLISGPSNWFAMPKEKPWLLNINDKGETKWIRIFDLDSLGLSELTLLEKRIYLLFARSIPKADRNSYFLFARSDSNGNIDYPKIKQENVQLKEEMVDCLVENIPDRVQNFSTEEIFIESYSRDLVGKEIEIKNRTNSKKEKNN